MPLSACCDLCDSRKPEFPRTEAIIKQYVLEKLAKHEPFYISPELNSDVVKPDPGFGLAFLAPLIGAVAGIAGSVAAVAAPVGSIAGTALAVKNLVSSPGGSAQQAQSGGQITVNPSFEAQVAADLQAKGIQLPSSIQGSVINAAALDLFGPGSGQWVILGGFLLLVVLLAR